MKQRILSVLTTDSARGVTLRKASTKRGERVKNSGKSGKTTPAVASGDSLLISGVLERLTPLQ